jgi:hypothetical protein
MNSELLTATEETEDYDFGQTFRWFASQAVNDSGLISAWRFVVSHAAKVGVAAYAFATIYGLLYSAALTRVTGFNPLIFFDVSDFALTGFRHPVGLVIPFVIFFALMLVNMFIAMPMFILQPSLQLLGASMQGGGRVPVNEVARARDTFRKMNRAILWLIWIATVGLTAAYVGVVPIVAVDQLASCTGTLTLLIGKDGGSEDKSAFVERQIIGASAKYLFVRNPAGGGFSALAIDTVKAASTGTNSATASWPCMITQL